MAKENTHLWFAYGLLEHCTGSAMLRDVSDHLGRYMLGAVILDTFYYSAGDDLVRISEAFHGRDGNPTNTTILRVIDAARGPADIAFILGYITHCALDITFHPVVYYLSGNYYDDDRTKRTGAVRRHRHLETCLDRDLGNTLRLHEVIRTSHLKGLVFEEIVARDFHTSIRAMRQALRRQIAFNLLFTSTAAYNLAKLAVASGVLRDPSYLGLFYADVAPCECTPSSIAVADLIDGSPSVTSVSELFSRARDLALIMQEAAYAYWQGTLDRTALERVIPGVSLDTGRLGARVSDIRYTSPDGEN